MHLFRLDRFASKDFHVPHCFASWPQAKESALARMRCIPGSFGIAMKVGASKLEYILVRDLSSLRCTYCDSNTSTLHRHSYEATSVKYLSFMFVLIAQYVVCTEYV